MVKVSATFSTNGSTAQHRQDLRREHTITSKFILEYGEAYIELLENYSCANNEELSKKQGESSRGLIIVPDRTKKEYNKQNKQYRETNKETLSEQKKEYYEVNKQVI